MKKRNLFLSAFLMFIGSSIQAQVVYGEEEHSYVKEQQKLAIQYRPTILQESKIKHDSYQLSGIGDNWFGSVQGGFASFVGDPVSHTDFSGRTKMGLDLSIGKWHSPYFGTRFVYQGFKFIDSERTKQSFSNYHADFLLNVSSFFRPSFDKPAKWNISPYIGAGVIRHNDLKKSFFAFSYGIWATYSLSQRISISASFGGTTTKRNFDGYGASDKFGDNLLSGSIGINIGIGNLGWKSKRKIKAVEYNAQLKYQPAATTKFPRNNYSGLNSLQERLANGTTAEVPQNKVENTSDVPNFDAPIFFFFKRNSIEFIDKQQMVNIREIASAVKKYDLEVRIIGAADKKTGTPKHNRKLSTKRCRYIAKLLRDAGVPISRMKGEFRGGVNMYKPYTANRHACVILHKRNNSN